jgi:protoporphyrinogen/coproporphyrinogen III oxidase
VMGIPANLDSVRDIPGISDEALQRARELDHARWTQYLDDATVAEVVTARLGSEILQTLVEPLCLGVHSSSAHDLEARAIFPEVLRVAAQEQSLVGAVAKVRGRGASPGSAVATIRGGLHRLIQALRAELERLGVTVQCDLRVDSITRGEEWWTVETSVGQHQSSHLSVCTGAAEASRLLDAMPEIAKELGEVSTVDQALSLVVVRAPELNDFPLGSGALVSTSLGIEAKATTHLNAKWQWWRDRLPQDLHLLRFSFGRGGVLPAEPYAELVAEAMRVLYRVDSPDIVAWKDVVWRGGVVKPTQGHVARVGKLHTLAEAVSLNLHGAYISGNGLLGISRSLAGGSNVRTH